MTMQSFEWDDNYLTGFTDVDEQHHHLVNMLNQFGDLLTTSELGVDDIETLLLELTDYTQHHFRDEEKLMQNTGIDSRHLRYHQQEHENFIQQLSAMDAEFSSISITSTKQILEFLTHWLAYHILGVDQNMARQLHAIQSGITADAAYLAEERKRSQSTEPLLAAVTGLFRQLTRSNKILVEMNKTLDAKVQERTQALIDVNSQLEMIAMTDVLTELPNRRYAMLTLRRLWAEAIENGFDLACMMIDADGFKRINDNYGHDAGDLVLKALAWELKHRVRTDDIVCRLGGDEFLIICTETPLEGALNLALQVCKAVADLQVPAGDGLWAGSISVGVAVRTPDMQDLNVLLKAADEGVYMAKRDGRKCVRSSQINTVI